MQRHVLKKIVWGILVITSVGIIQQISAASDILNPKKLFSKKTSVSTSAPTATLEFSKEGKRLYVYIVIQQTQDVSNAVKVVWNAPDNSICGDSEYGLKYSGLHYKTRAYRTVTVDTQDGDPLTCIGDWKVSILDANGKEIASDIFTVQDDGVLDKAVTRNTDDEESSEEDDETLTQ